ncbi:hypothetical protein BKA56DRAFT_680097 [Ilyonectria sp. MPI-CAGE-AT-0026]|nr:hypothetical protein BKA56DRAFT_680097 [Ilyonectria sp. MPI-CAGE-AT-0026]
MRDERSWQVRIFLATVSIQSLFSPRDRLIPREHLRLTTARHDLLIVILVHSLLWTRDGVVDAFGKGVALERRWVLSPDAIVQFMDKVRDTNRRYRYEQVRDFLEKVPVGSLDKDVSSWISTNVAVVASCWDALHRLGEVPACACRLAAGESKGREPDMVEVENERV